MKKQLSHLGKEETRKLTISVILPVLFSSRTSRRNETLRTALNSISNQTVLPTEVIVVAGGDLSNTHQFKWPNNLKIKIIEEREESSPAKARNLGIQSAKGDIIAFLDSDDIWSSKYLEVMLNLFQEKQIKAAYAMAFSTINGLMFARTSEIVKESQANALMFRNFIQAMSAFMLRKSIFISLGGFNEELAQTEDLEFYVRLSQCVKIHPIPLFLVERRVGDDSLTSDYTQRFFDIIKAHEVIAKHSRQICKPELISFLAFLRIWRIINKMPYYSISRIKAFVIMLSCVVLRFRGKISILKGAFQYFRSIKETGKLGKNQISEQENKNSLVITLNMSLFGHSEFINNSFLKQLGLVLQSKYDNIKLIPLNTSRVCDDRVPLTGIATAAKTKLQVMQNPPEMRQLHNIVKAAKLVITNSVFIAKIAVEYDVKTVFVFNKYEKMKRTVLPKDIQFLDINSISSVADESRMQWLTEYFGKL